MKTYYDDLFLAGSLLTIGQAADRVVDRIRVADTNLEADLCTGKVRRRRPKARKARAVSGFSNLGRRD